MQIHTFQSAERVFGFTKDSTGANLPTRYGNWTAFKVLEMVRGQRQPGVNTDECLDDIEKYGFHLTEAHVRITEQAI